MRAGSTESRLWFITRAYVERGLRGRDEEENATRYYLFACRGYLYDINPPLCVSILVYTEFI